MAEFHLKGIINNDVLSGCIAGNRESQETLYRYFAPKMFGICLRYANDYPGAEDILQEGFIKIFNNLDKFRREGSFEGWIKRIFVNTAIEHYRKNVQKGDWISLDSVYNNGYESEAFEHLATQDLLNVIQKLPSGYRTVFNLYAIEGYSHKEIGNLLNISEGTSKSQLARARMTLKKLLAKHQ